MAENPDPAPVEASPHVQSDHDAADSVLTARGLTKRFGGFAAVSNVDLSVRRGAIHALIGPNGAGKTTCFNLLTKTLAPTSGQIIFDGVDITAERAADVAKLGLVRSFQISATFPELTALENVRIALQSEHGMGFSFWRSLRALQPLNGRAHDLLEQVGLGALARTKAADLSYGKKRALEIATTLALDPRIMLLDEPTAGMGHEDIEPITELIRETGKG
ncbi:MAG: ABC transporter ATP-binding protein, partial [Alphaproteobacteria bacterium]|nr:ABC transporter ATP-binding protein [Alphaproteobacteria bacterium]